MKQIIIQGAGFVGGATRLFLETCLKSDEWTIQYNDPYKNLYVLEPYWKEASWVFICVPTNIDETTGENSMINVLDAINYAIEKGYRGSFVVRSTLPISGVNQLNDWLGDKFILWPEYIREKHMLTDAISPREIVLGINGVNGIEFGKLLWKYNSLIQYVTPMEAQLAKLATNTFLSMKVIFANLLKQLAEQNECQYDRIVDVLLNEGRLGKTHWTVPGPDGKFGFGGTCFPKDTQTFATALKSVGVESSLIDAVVETNKVIRKDS